MGAGVQTDPPAGEHTCFPLPPAAADEGPRPGQQHRQGEGLCHVVIRTQGIAPEHVLLVPKGGEEQNGHGAVPPHRPAHPKAVQPGHEHVQGHRVVVVVPQQLQGLLAIPGQVTLQAVGGEIVPDNVPHVPLVLHHQNAVHRLLPLSVFRIRPTCVRLMSSP